MCEVWFEYTSDHGTADSSLEPTTAAKSWLSSNGYGTTHDDMCDAEAPWPLDNSNHISVKTVCQSICNYCASGSAQTTKQLSTRAPGAADQTNAACKFELGNRKGGD